MSEPIHSYVRRLREARGKWLSQRELARLAGLAPSTVLRMEQGQHAPSAASLRAVAPYLGTTEDDLLIRAGYREVRDEPPSVAAADPLVVLRAVLQRGPWPEEIATAAYALLAACAKYHRALPNVDAPPQAALPDPTSHHVVEYRPATIPADEDRRTLPAPQ